MIAGSFEQVRTDPAGCATWLCSAGGFAGTATTVVMHTAAVTVFDVQFPEPPQDALPGFPAERVRISVGPDGEVVAVPVPGQAGKRSWLHRYPLVHPCSAVAREQKVPWIFLFAGLCLEYPKDPDHLRWSWDDGIDAYLRVVERHLWYEEQWRRTGVWPVEDTPHGERPDGSPHPISLSMVAA